MPYPIEAAPNRPLAAAGMVLIFAVVIGFTDNYVRVIATDGGLWQFHAIRTAMVFTLVGLAAVPLALRLRPNRPRAVALRSLLHGSAMLVYFGCLAFLPVAQVAAGLFVAPIFVLLFSRFAFGHRIGPYRIAAVAVGFLGILMVLGPEARGSLGLYSVLPVAAGALYALGNIATREWCGGESALVLTLGFFAALGLFGLVGMGLLALWPLPVAAGEAGFVTRGAVWPSGAFLFWTMVQAVGSLGGVMAAVRAYQLAEASRVAIFEYMVLPIAALWGWVLWAEVPGALAVLGMVFIFAAGAVIALRTP